GKHFWAYVGVFVDELIVRHFCLNCLLFLDRTQNTSLFESKYIIFLEFFDNFLHLNAAKKLL
ncbi:hypothetical protein, partial [Pseudoalteromonas marina]